MYQRLLRAESCQREYAEDIDGARLSAGANSSRDRPGRIFDSFLEIVSNVPGGRRHGCGGLETVVAAVLSVDRTSNRVLGKEG